MVHLGPRWAMVHPGLRWAKVCTGPRWATTQPSKQVGIRQTSNRVCIWLPWWMYINSQTIDSCTTGQTYGQTVVPGKLIWRTGIADGHHVDRQVSQVCMYNISYVDRQVDCTAWISIIGFHRILCNSVYVLLCYNKSLHHPKSWSCNLITKTLAGRPELLTSPLSV